MFRSNQDINTEKIKHISMQIKSGVQYENPTIELKRQFWDLSNDEGKNEFAKDLTLMANSQYGVGNIIIGIDGDTGDLYHSTLPYDAADLANIINRKVLEPFTVEFNEIQVDENNIIVVHIPNSYNKPHMLRSFRGREMFIPIRKGTRTTPADKYDLDLMYTEREKIVIPPYRLEPFIGDKELLIRINYNSRTCLINILNTGSRINMIIGGRLTVYYEDTEIAKLDLTQYYIPGVNQQWQKMSDSNFLLIKQNDVIRVNLSFNIEDTEKDADLRQNINSYSAQITLIDVAGNESFTNIVNLKDS